MNDESLSLDINFYIKLSSEDNEIRGEVEELDIVVYEDDVKDVSASVKEYIKEIYDDLRNTKDSELTTDLKLQKEVLTTFIIKTK